MNISQLKVKVTELGPNEPYMSSRVEALFREHLNYNLKDIQEQQRKEKDAYARIDLNLADPVDRAEATRVQEESHRRSEQLSSEAKKTIRAIKSIQDSEYGYCVECGIEIGLERLLTRPNCIRDMDCENLHEQKLARENGLRR